MWDKIDKIKLFFKLPSSKSRLWENEKDKVTQIILSKPTNQEFLDSLWDLEVLQDIYEAFNPVVTELKPLRDIILESELLPIYSSEKQFKDNLAEIERKTFRLTTYWAWYLNNIIWWDGFAEKVTQIWWSMPSYKDAKMIWYWLEMPANLW